MSVEIIPAESLLNAYAEGVFPMAEDGEILWFSPTMRGLIPLDDRFHVSRSLRRALNKNPFEIRMNGAFEQVMEGCSEREETWIDPAIIASYTNLHKLGFAECIECWDDEGLQGGIYGVTLGKVFFGESMFSRKKNASKIAMVFLVEYLREQGYTLFDTQWITDHLKQFGGYEVPRDIYLSFLAESLRQVFEN